MLAPENAQTQRATVLISEGFNPSRVFAIPRDTDGAAPSAEARSALISALGLFAQADAGVRELRQSARSESEHETAQYFATEARGRLHAMIVEGNKVIAADRESIAARRTALLAVPAAPDAATVALDIDIQRRLAALPNEARRTLHAEIAAGKADRVLLALARDPLPGADQAFAVSTWQARMAKQHAEALTALDAEAEGADAVEAGLRSIADVIA